MLLTGTDFLSLPLFEQSALMTSSCAAMVELMDKHLLVYQVSNSVMVSVTAVEEKMKRTTTVHVHQSWQFVWWMALCHIAGELSFAEMRSGQQFVIFQITTLLPLCVASLDFPVKV